MSQWIAFDRATAEAVQSKTGSSVEVRNAGDTSPGSVVGMAAAAPSRAIAVIPAAGGQHALVVRFSHPARPRPQVPPPIAGTRTAPGGFLGLADELVLDDQPGPPKKWWQKILD